jgi:hypothetical protein
MAEELNDLDLQACLAGARACIASTPITRVYQLFT